MLPKLAMLAVATWVGALAKGVSPTFQFKVDESTVIGCGTFKFNFTRGVPPYTMTTIPLGSPVKHFENFDYNETGYGGAAELQLPYGSYEGKEPSVSQLVFVMSDATGFGSGGVSGLIDVIESPNFKCKRPASSMIFYTSGDFTEPEHNEDMFKSCQTVDWYWPTEGTDPSLRIARSNGTVTLAGVIPNGEVWMPDDEIDQEAGHLSTTLNIAQSTQVIYAVWDSEGSTDTHSGKVNPGSSDCLTGDSPTTVSQTPWEQITSKPTTMSAGAKAGIAISVIVAVALLVLVGVLLWRLRHSRKIVQDYSIDMVGDDEDGTKHDIEVEVQDQSVVPTPFLSPSTDQSHSSFGKVLTAKGGTGAASSAVEELTFVHHEDAGSAEPKAVGGVVDVPPTYNPAWSDSASSSMSSAQPMVTKN